MSWTTAVAVVVAAAVAAETGDADAAASVEYPTRFTDHYVQFLRNNPHRNRFALHSYETNVDKGTFGGRVEVEEESEESGEERRESPEIRHDPVVFVHGNTESALYLNVNATGWNQSIEYFLRQGYSMAEMYGLTHGYRSTALALKNKFTCELFKGVRNHIESVLAYTQMPKIDIIAHSMGVTIARAAILGGTVHFMNETCHLGDSLAEKVDTFLAIAGANYGVCYCALQWMMMTDVCTDDSFATGICRIRNEDDAEMKSRAPVYCATESCDNPYSRVLRQLNDRNEPVADFTVSTWTNGDEILGGSNMAWGKRTSHMPLSDLTIEYTGLNHGEVKDLTARHQFELITMHDVNVQVPGVKEHHRRNHRHHKNNRMPYRHLSIGKAPEYEHKVGRLV